MENLQKTPLARLEAMSLTETDASTKSEILAEIASRKAANASKTRKSKKTVETAPTEEPTIQNMEQVQPAAQEAAQVVNEPAAQEAATVNNEQASAAPAQEVDNDLLDLLGGSDGDDALAAAVAAAGGAAEFVSGAAEEKAPKKTKEPKAPKAPKAEGETKEKGGKEYSGKKTGPIATITTRQGAVLTGPVVREIRGTDGLPYILILNEKKTIENEDGTKTEVGDNKLYMKQKGQAVYADAEEQEKANEHVAKVKAELAVSNPWLEKDKARRKKTGKSIEEKVTAQEGAAATTPAAEGTPVEKPANVYEAPEEDFPA